MFIVIVSGKVYRLENCANHDRPSAFWDLQKKYYAGALWQYWWSQQTHLIPEGDGGVPSTLPRSLWEVPHTATQVNRIHILTLISQSTEDITLPWSRFLTCPVLTTPVPNLFDQRPTFRSTNPPQSTRNRIHTHALMRNTHLRKIK